MHKHDEPYKHYHVYIPVRVYEVIAKEAARKKVSISQEVEIALGWYSEKLKEFNEAMQADAQRLQAEYEEK